MTEMKGVKGLLGIDNNICKTRNQRYFPCESNESDGKGKVTDEKRKLEWGTYHVQCKHSVKFDQAVKPAKENRHREQGNVRGISNVVAEVLDEFAHKHPYEETVHGDLFL